MHERDLARVLWARAIEDADPEGDLVRTRARDRATLEARGACDDADDDEAFLIARAESLLEAFSRSSEDGRGTAAASLARAPELVGWLPPAAAFFAVGVALGLVSEMLGSVRAINLLAIPLLGLLAWNVALYGYSLVRLAGGGHATSPEWMRQVLARLRLRLARRGAGGRKSPGARAVANLGALWAAHGARPCALRLRARLHLAAAGFGVGAIAALYLAGFSFAYQATWESTFLDADGAARFLGWVLAPGSAILGETRPTPDALAAIRAPAGGPAAAWIHRWSATLLALVVVPRLLLAGLAGVRARRAARRVTPPLGDAYFTRLLARRARGGRRVELIPYSTQLEARAGAIAREIAIELFGNTIDLQVREPTPYGAPFETSADGDAAPEATILVFNLAQTPELEVQARFLEELIAARPPADDSRLLVLLDAQRYAGSTETSRVEERERAWQRVLREAGAEAVVFAATERLDPGTLEAAAARLAASTGAAA